MSTYSIREIINKVSDGVLRIPKFQRGFVWDSDSVAFLMDSIFKGYPFGTIQLWRTKEALQTERKFGPFELFDREADYPIDYVLDGQQRITSIFGTFQSEIDLPDNTLNPFAIYFDFSIEDNQQESQFLFLEPNDINPDKHFPLNCLFDTIKYRQATESLDDKTTLKIDALQETFKESKIPYQILETDDRSKVAIVFERINRKGVPLDTFQLLTAWTWSDAFDLQEKFELLQEDLEPFGFYELGENIDLLLRVCSAVLTKDATPKALIELNGNTVRDNFDKIVNGIKGAIDFIKSEFRVVKLSNLPYETVVIPLAVLFAVEDGRQFQLSQDSRNKIVKWFWKVLFSRRYSAGTRKNLNRDIDEILKIKEGQESKLENITVNFQSAFFLENKFNVRSVNTKTFILLLAQINPRNFISGTNVVLREVLQVYNKKEFHHLNPKAFVDTIENQAYSVDALANYCIISKTDNNQLGGDRPSIYKKKMADNREQILASAACDEYLFEDNFENTLERRADYAYPHH